MRINGTSLEQSVRMQEQQAAHLSFPEVDKVFAQNRYARCRHRPMPPNVADVFVILKPHGAWPDPKRSKGRLSGGASA